MILFKGLRDNQLRWLCKIKGEWLDYFTGVGHIKVSRRRPSKQYIRYPSDYSHLVSDHKRRFDEHVWLRVPRVREIIYAYASDASCGRELFKDFCSDLGYDPDSRSALDTYLKCQDAALVLRRMKIDVERINSWEL